MPPALRFAIRNSQFAIRIYCLTFNDSHYTIFMSIKSFRCSDTKALYDGHHPRRFRQIETVARRKLQMLDSAVFLQDLRRLPETALRV